MFRIRLAMSAKFVFSVVLLALAVMPAHAQIGPYLTGAGAVNRSMGGASTAAPIDGAGALYWNSATIMGLPSSSVDLGVELLWNQTRLSSIVPASGFGPGIPPITLAGSDRGDNSVMAVPALALVYRPDDSVFAYGLGVFHVASFGVNYPASGTNPAVGPVNPILTGQPPRGFGLGSVFSNLQYYEFTPTLAVQLTDRLAIGMGPTVTIANFQIDPLIFVAPNGNGEYPIGTHTRTAWGAGFQFGAYYTMDGGWAVGASVKSPQWMDAFRFQTVDNAGRPRHEAFTLNMPLIASFGIGYTGIERWTFAADFRYVDYGHTDGFKQSGYAPTGAVQGFGFRNVFAMSLGAQNQVTDRFSVRAGYSYNQDPISAAQSSFNVAMPTITEHAIYFGSSLKVTSALSVSLGYMHGFQNSIDGPLVTPFGPIANSSIRNTASADALMLSATVLFGGR